MMVLLSSLVARDEADPLVFLLPRRAARFPASLHAAKVGRALLISWSLLMRPVNDDLPELLLPLPKLKPKRPSKKR